MRLDVSEVVIHPEYRDPAYALGKEGPKVFRSESTCSSVHSVLKYLLLFSLKKHFLYFFVDLSKNKSGFYRLRMEYTYTLSFFPKDVMIKTFLKGQSNEIF